MDKKLSKLVTIKNLREIWKKEATDFTRWLAEETNLNFLSETIGCDIELIKTEADVGRCSVDILAKDPNSNKKIIIENQLEHTDHDHLGKVVIYASGHDVGLAIWIVKKAKEEHIRAVEWLNEKTDDTIGFFLLEIEVFTIGNSDPAPRFNIVVKPNEWAKAVKADIVGLTNTKQKQLDLWSDLKSYIEQNNSSLSCHSPRAQHWYNFAVGSSMAHISLTVNTRDNYLGCELHIPKIKDFYHFLGLKKDKIENELGKKCEWIDAPIASRILIKNKVDNPLTDTPEVRTKHLKWLLENVLLFKKVFSPLCREYAKKH